MQVINFKNIHWTTIGKIWFRFCFLYFTIYIFFTPNNELPAINYLYEYLNNVLHSFIPWFATNVLGFKQSITEFTNGSGDTRYDYVLWLFGLLLTIAGTVIWTLLDGKRKSYNSLFYWLTVFLRYYLFYTMIMYGIVKIIKLQFPFPGLTRLVQPYGDSSPMGLAWTYMGYSTTYNYFTGMAEIAGGLLLLFRRTTTLGALVCFGVMMNVFMMNMSYDIPVKLLSFNTVLMSLFLIWKDLKRLVNVFFLNKPTEGVQLAFPHKKNWVRYSAATLKWLFIAFILITNTTDAVKGQKEYGAKAAKPPLYGIYNVQHFVRNSDTITPLQTDTTRWKQFIISREGVAFVKLMNDSLRRYAFEVDSLQKSASVYKQTDTTKKYRLECVKGRDSSLILTGSLWGDSIKVFMNRYDENKFRLVNRGFHWINEYPFNR
jgi:uncharacterized membrane protein YphA (DoxX/SURF4 family)